MINVYSKIKLSDELKNLILESLMNYLKENVDAVRIKFLLDDKIFAGIKIEIDSEIIDLTLNHRLNKIIEALNNA